MDCRRKCTRNFNWYCNFWKSTRNIKKELHIVIIVEINSHLLQKQKNTKESNMSEDMQYVELQAKVDVLDNITIMIS